MKQTKKVLLYNNYILYEDGRWFSLKHLKFLKPFKNSSGYDRVDVFDNGVKKRVFTHIKVVENFGDCKGNKIPFNNGTLRELGLSIDHRDRDKHNNSRKNLEIVTHQENCLRKSRGCCSEEDDSLPF